MHTFKGCALTSSFKGKWNTDGLKLIMKDDSYSNTFASQVNKWTVDSVPWALYSATEVYLQGVCMEVIQILYEQGGPWSRCLSPYIIYIPGKMESWVSLGRKGNSNIKSRQSQDRTRYLVVGKQVHQPWSPHVWKLSILMRSENRLQKGDIDSKKIYSTNTLYRPSTWSQNLE